MRPHAGLWDWAREVYSRPGVEVACLALQDDHGQCVSFLLWVAWAALDGRTVDASTLARAAGLAKAWDKTVVQPLRSARRALRTSVGGIDAKAQAALGQRVGAEELAAERLLLNSLEALTPAGRQAPRPAAAALSSATSTWGRKPPDAALEALASAFSPS